MKIVTEGRLKTATHKCFSCSTIVEVTTKDCTLHTLDFLFPAFYLYKCPLCAADNNVLPKEFT